MFIARIKNHCKRKIKNKWYNMKYDWFPWYPTKFRGATMHLSAEQDGIYRRLIDHYMETEKPLPDNDTALARIAGVSEDSFKLSSTVLKAFFKSKNGRLFHETCDKNLEDMNARYLKMHERAKKGGKARGKQLSENKVVLASSLAASSQQAKLNPATLPYHTLPNKEVVVVIGDLKTWLCGVTGWDQLPIPKNDGGRIEQWLANGWDVDKDIKPTIADMMESRKMQNLGPPGSAKYFEQAIADNHKRRLSPLPEGKLDVRKSNKPKSAVDQAREYMERGGI